LKRGVGAYPNQSRPPPGRWIPDGLCLPSSTFVWARNAPSYGVRKSATLSALPESTGRIEGAYNGCTKEGTRRSAREQRRRPFGEDVRKVSQRGRPKRAPAKIVTPRKRCRKSATRVRSLLRAQGCGPLKITPCLHWRQAKSSPARPLAAEYLYRRARYSTVACENVASSEKFFPPLWISSGLRQGVRVRAFDSAADDDLRGLAGWIDQAGIRWSPELVMAIGPADGWVKKTETPRSRSSPSGRITLPHDLPWPWPPSRSIALLRSWLVTPITRATKPLATPREGFESPEERTEPLKRGGLWFESVL